MAGGKGQMGFSPKSVSSLQKTEWFKKASSDSPTEQ